MAIHPVRGMDIDSLRTSNVEAKGTTVYCCTGHFRREFLAQQINDRRAAGDVHASQSHACQGDEKGRIEKSVVTQSERATMAGKDDCPVCRGGKSDRPGTCPKCRMAMELAKFFSS